METNSTLFNSLKNWTGIKKELKKVVFDLSKAATEIVDLLANGELNKDVLGETTSKNVHREQVKQLDLIANEAFINQLRKNSTVKIIVSEENVFPIFNQSEGKYLVAIDPLDGSSNIDVNISVGTIFGIYDKTENLSGRNLVLAGYFIYGSSTNLVLSDGKQTKIFTFSIQTHEFLCTHENFKSPNTGLIYSVNEAKDAEFDFATQKFINHCKINPDFSARYVGSLIADFHRNLLKGGVFVYPATFKNPKGKLRLAYECNPLALIAQSSNCSSISGNKYTLDVPISDIHQKETLVIGTKNLVQKYLAFLFASNRLKKVA